MKLLNKFLALLTVTSVMFTACKKLEVPAPLGDRGQTIVKFMTLPNEQGLNFNLSSILVLSTPQKVGLIEIRRDVPNESQLNKSLTVTVKDDPAAVTALNLATGQNFIPLPAGSYTVDAANPFANGVYTVTFQPGEFSKTLYISITNATTLVLTNKYAVGLTLVTQVTGLDGRISFQNRTVVVQVGISNQYAGKYKAIGIFHHPTAGDRAINELKDVLTVNANTVRAPLADLGGSGYYMLITVNANNTVTLTPSGVTPNIDQSYGPNYWDPVAKKFVLNYAYNVAAPRIVEETLTKQ